MSEEKELEEVTEDVQEFVDAEGGDGPGELDKLEEGDVEQDDLEEDDA